MELSSSKDPFHQSFFADGDSSRQQIVYGPNSRTELGSLAKKLGSRALVVTDEGLSRAGHAQDIEEELRSSGLRVALYDRSIENPSDSSVQLCAQFAKAEQVDLIIGLGGGSSMDTAKGCNFILTNGGKMTDYWGIGKASKPMLPLIAIPTTAGTGSECQSFALISEDQTHKKMACGDSKALPRFTILDPELTLSQPDKVTAFTGIDALAHALESAVTIKRNELSSRHSFLAFELINDYLPKVLEYPMDLESRGQVLLGASHAGAAIERSMLGAAHSMANPLTAHNGLVHGMAVGVCLPIVMAFNAENIEVRSIYANLARKSQICSQGSSDLDAAQSLINRVSELLNLAKFPTSLLECGVASEELSTLAMDASLQWTARFNPRAIGKEEFEILYGKLIDGSSCRIKISETN